MRPLLGRRFGSDQYPFGDSVHYLVFRRLLVAEKASVVQRLIVG